MPNTYTELPHHSPTSLAAAQAAARDSRQRMRWSGALLVVSALITALLVINERFSELAPAHVALQQWRRRHVAAA